MVSKVFYKHLGPAFATKIRNATASYSKTFALYNWAHVSTLVTTIFGHPVNEFKIIFNSQWSRWLSGVLYFRSVTPCNGACRTRVLSSKRCFRIAKCPPFSSAPLFGFGSRFSWRIPRLLSWYHSPSRSRCRPSLAVGGVCVLAGSSSGRLSEIGPELFTNQKTQ